MTARSAGSELERAAAAATLETPLVVGGKPTVAVKPEVWRLLELLVSLRVRVTLLILPVMVEILSSNSVVKVAKAVPVGRGTL